MVIDTIYIVSRTIIFVYYVECDPQRPINAFSIAQLVSSVILCLAYYCFFFWYIRALNNVKAIEKKKQNTQNEKKVKTIFSDMNDFPITSFWQLFPGIMDNEVFFLYFFKLKSFYINILF